MVRFLIAVYYKHILQILSTFVLIYQCSLKSSLTILDNFKSNVDTQSNMFVRVSLDS